MLSAADAPNVFELGFEECWEQARAYAASIRLPARCAVCAARDNCKACGAMVYTESGNFHSVPEYRCEMTKAYPDACMQLAREIEERMAKA